MSNISLKSNSEQNLTKPEPEPHLTNPEPESNLPNSVAVMESVDDSVYTNGTATEKSILDVEETNTEKKEADEKKEEKKMIVL